MNFAARITGLLLFASACFGDNIVTPIPGSETFGSPQTFKEFEATIKREDGVTDQVLKYRVYRYGPKGQNMPFLVQVHEWGGSFSRMEGIANWEKTNLPFVMLSFQFANADDNTANWWYGLVNRATSETVPYVSNAIMKIIRQAMTTDMVSNAVECTIDTNRIYLFGHSIGGTGAVQLGMRHPEIFAAVSAHAGWTTFADVDRAAGKTNLFRVSFNSIIGTVAGVNGGPNPMPDQSKVTIRKNADLTHLPLGEPIPAFQYTNLNWYFRNVRDPSWPSPFLYYVCGNADDPVHQGDNLQPALEDQKRGYTYHRASGPHTAGGVFVRMDKMYKFRRDQSFLAFTNRKYGLNALEGSGMMNDLSEHGWDPATIVETASSYVVKLTGKGTSDVTLQRLQKLGHAPGTSYKLRINGTEKGQVVADKFGLLTIPNVSDDALIELGTPSVRIGSAADHRKAGSRKRIQAKVYPEGLADGQSAFNASGRRLPASAGSGKVPGAAGMLVTP